MNLLETLIEDQTLTPALPLPESLRTFYGGELRFPPPPTGRPLVIGNFVETLDGVVSYALPNNDTGNTISGNNPEDHLLMGLLRSCADAVIWGAGTYTASRRFVPTPAAIAPTLASDYAALRTALGKPSAPLAIVITRTGDIPLDGAMFTDPAQPAVIATTVAGAARLSSPIEQLPNTEVQVLGDDLTPADILAMLHVAYGVQLALHEGGPSVFGAFLAAGCLDELFLTLAPQFAGRDATAQRPALVESHAFLPTTAPWATLVSLKRQGHVLFSRYRIAGPHGEP